MRNFSVLALLAIIIISCKGSSDFKKINDFKDSEWLLANQQVFEFEIKDITKSYRFHYLIRNAVSYPYYNIYLFYLIKNQENLKVTAWVIFSITNLKCLLFKNSYFQKPENTNGKSVTT